MRWLVAGSLLGLAVAAGLYGSATSPAVQACGLLGPYDFDTHESADPTADYALAIELSVAGVGVTTTYQVDGEVVDLRYQGVETGSRQARQPRTTGQRVPPTLYKSIAWIESNWANAAASVPYGGVGPTLRSFDCGYGLGQVTSGMYNDQGLVSAKQAFIGTHPLFNLAEGVRILADKWNGAPERSPIAGSGNPAILEDWYYAIWAYNGFAFLNHPLNPDFHPLRGGNETSPLYHCYEPKAHSYQDSGNGLPKFGYGDYTYPERVYGCMKYPPRARAATIPSSANLAAGDAAPETDTGAGAVVDRQELNQFSPGDPAVVVVDTCLRIRETPSTSGAEIACIPNGTAVTVLEGPVYSDSDGYYWWKIQSPGGTGWSVDDYLAPAGSAPPTPTPVPPPSPPTPLPPPLLDGPRLWSPVAFRMPEFGHPAIAAAFAVTNFTNCRAAGFAGGCPAMDFPTTISEWGIFGHVDPTGPVNPALAARFLGEPRMVVSGPSSVVLGVTPGGESSSTTIQVSNAGTAIAPFRIRTSHSWIRVRHPSDTGTRTLDASVAIGTDIIVVLQKGPPPTTQAGWTSLLRLSLDPEGVPRGTTAGSVIIEPLMGGGVPFVVSVTALNTGASPFGHRVGLPTLGRD